MAYLSVFCRGSRRIIEEFIETVFQVPMSLGTIANLEQETSAALRTPDPEAPVAVRAASLQNADETSGKQAGKKRWLGMAATPAVAGFKIGLGRGRAELREWRGDAIQGVVCRDRLSVSNPVALALRQVCGSHRKRDFQKGVDRGGEAGLKVGQTGGEAARQRFARGVIFARNAWTDRRYRRRSSRCQTNSAPCCRRAR